MCAKYGNTQRLNFHELVCSNATSSTVSDIHSIVISQPKILEVWTKSKWEVNNGMIVLFWADFWIGTQPLKTNFPRLSSLSLFKFTTVKEFLNQWNSKENHFSQGWQRPLKAWEEASVLQLQEIIAAVSLRVGVDKLL